MAYRLLAGAALCLLSVLPVVSQAQTVTFVDDEGAAAATLLDGSTARVRVVDPAADTSAGHESISAHVTSTLAGDGEYLTLVETGSRSGIFEGEIDLQANAYLGWLNLSTATTAGPPPARDTIQATYGSVTASAGLVASIIEFLDDWDRPSSTFVAGHTVRLRVRDQLRNNSQSRDSFTVTVISQSTSDSAIVALAETGLNTGVFEGTFGTSRFSSDDLFVAVPDVISITLPAGDGVTSTAAQAQIAGSALVLRDGEGEPADTFLESAPVHFLVTAPGLYQSGIEVQVTSALTGDVETLFLPGTGVVAYEGQIPTKLAAGTPTPGDGILQIGEVAGPPRQFDTVTVTYAGADGTATDSAGFLPGRIMFLNAHGAVTSSYAAGSEVHVRLEYPEGNTPFLDQSVVRLTNLSTGEEEDLPLRETRRDSGVFEGSMPLGVSGSSPSFDEVLNAQPGEQIRAESGWGGPVTAQIAAGSLEILDRHGEPTQVVVEGGQALVRLFSPADNANPAQADGVAAETWSRIVGDFELLALDETGPSTGVFEGQLRLTTDWISTGFLRTSNSGAPDYQQDQVYVWSGASEATARVVPAQIEYLDAFGRRTSVYAAGETVRLRIEDHYKSSYLDVFPVTLVSLQTGDSETVNVQETGPGTGIFVGSIATALYGGVAADGRLGVDLAETIEARFTTNVNQAEITGQATIRGNAIRFVDAAGQPATVYLESSRAYVEVVSAIHNSSPTYADSVSVQLGAEISPDIETLTLTETGSNTGVFAGSIQMRFTSSFSSGNGILETFEADNYGLYELDTVRATFYSPYGGDAVARIGLTGSRTWFGNAAGTEVLSYVAGATAHVWVEDQNRNQPGTWDAVSVEMRSPATGDLETLQLQETTRDSGLFHGTIELALTSSSGDGKLSGTPGSQIEASHQDFAGYTASSAVADIVGSSVDFIDEDGQPTSTLLKRGVARVRVFSVGSNASPAYAESVTVNLQTRNSSDQETLYLTETGPDTSVFEGSISMETGSGYTGNGTLETMLGGYPVYTQDVVTAQFETQTATAQVVGARVVYLDGAGGVTASYVVGETVRVQVTDHDRNYSSTYRETFSITITSRDAGDSESVTMEETGLDTSVFTGSIPSVLGGGASPNNGQLSALPDDQVEIRYQPYPEPDEIVATAAMKGNGVLFLDAAGQPATVYLESSRAYVRVVSASANANPSSADTMPVQLLAELSQDTETLTLTETGPSTSVFEGSIPLRLVPGTWIAGNGILETIEDGHPQFDPPHKVDTLRATYSDPAGTSVAQIGLTGSRTWFADAAGSEVLSYPVGGTAWVWVEDQNRNQPGAWDTVYVELRAPGNGDQEWLQLRETTRDSGIFAASLELAAGASQSGDGKLEVAPGSQIEASHMDAWGATASSAVADITALSITFIDESGEPAAELLERGDARVRMFYLNGNSSPYTAESYYATLRALRSNDMESVALTETGPDTGVFEGSLPMEMGGGYSGNGVLGTITGNAPEYLPEEVTASYLDQQATALVRGARVTFVDAYGREAASYVAGQAVRVRVVDYTNNMPDTRNTVQITIVSRDGADSENLTLQETGFNTAVFEGALPTTLGGAGSASDGNLRVYPGDEVEARFVQLYPIVARAAITGNAVLFIDAAGQPATVYLESSRAYVRVVSSLANLNPSSADTLPVQLLSELSQDNETLTLTETGPGTSVFEGSIALRLVPGTWIAGNGILESIEDGHPVNDPPHEFDTLRATYSDPAGTSVALAGLTGSRTWFADAAGQEVLSYPLGGTAYVRVEDQNRNQPGVWDTVYVEVRSTANGDVEQVQLLETTRDSGVFAIALELVYSNGSQSGDGKLQVVPYYQIEATHLDAWGVTASSAVADIAASSITFVDENGDPTTELLERDRARVRILSIYSNTDPSTVQTRSITVRTLRSGETESLTVTETGPDTSVFEGSIPLQMGGGASGDGILGTLNSGWPEYLPERVTAEYGGAEATALVLGARLTFIDAYGREAASYAAGEPVRVRVVDYTNNAPDTRNSVQITVVSRDGADSETLVLEETGFNTAVFEGALPTSSSGAGSASDGHLRVYPGDEVEARFVQAYLIVARAAITGNAVLFIDAAGQPATVFLESSRAFVRVTSTYGNSNPSAPDTLPVQLLAELSQDNETLTLTETGPGTSVFEGSIALRLVPGTWIAGNGILETVEDGHPVNDPPHEFDTLRATFTDPAGTSVARIGLAGSHTWFGDAAGQEVASYPEGGTAWVWVEDQNRNQPGVWDTVYVEVRAQGNGDVEQVQLLETTRNSGIFRTSLELARSTAAQNGDGKLQVAERYTITASHQDAWGATSSTAQARITDLSITFVDENGEPTTELLERDRARVRVFFQAANLNPSAVDTQAVYLQALRSGEGETLAVTETGPDTGVFEGSIQLQMGGGTSGDGVLGTINSGWPEYLPEEVSASFYEQRATALVLGARLTFIDAWGREVARYAAGEPVRVRIVDHTNNTPDTRNSVQVTLVSRDGADSESLTLQETGFDTAVFEGTLPTTFGGAGSASNGNLRVFPGDEVEARFVQAYPIVARVAITGNAVLFIDAAGQPATAYLESSRAYVRVMSTSANSNSSAPDTLPVQLLAELSQDNETLALTETGPSTSVFEGSIALRLVPGTWIAGNGILETVEDGHPVNDPPHEFDTLRATFTDPAGTSVARVGLTGSHTWFGDATSREVASYPAGGTAWVWVEDQNRNQPGVWDTVYVEVRAQGSSDVEQVQLLETTRDSGVFKLALEVVSGAAQTGDGKLQATPGSTITATHQDAWGATSSTAQAEISDLSLTFIDESGEPTTELLDRDRARVRMFYVSGNSNPNTVQTQTVTLHALRSGETESLTLAETGPDTGVFEGSIQLQMWGGISGDGVLGTLNSAWPEYLPEEVSAVYGGERATALVLGARVTFIDTWGQETASYAAGEPVRVRIVDHTNNAPDTRNTVQVTLVSRDGADSESLTLQETGFDTAVFEGTLPTTFGGAGGASNGNLRVYSGDEVEARFVQAYPIVARVAITGNAVLFIDAAGQPATAYLESSRAFVRVMSSLANLNPSSADTLPVQLLAELSQDNETLTLTETGPGTSVFEGSIALRLVPGTWIAGNGVLETVEDGHPVNDPPHEFDTLRATFSDALGTSVARVGLTGSHTWFGAATGKEVASYPAGGTAWVWVEDQNRNQPGVWDTVYVEVRAQGSSDVEQVQLLETTRSGIFAIALELVSGGGPQNGDGKLQVMPGSTITATHLDAWGATSSTAQAQVTDLSLTFVDENGEPTTELLERGDARVRMFYVSGNSNPNTTETQSVTVQALRSGETESLTLTETGPNTGVFEGSILLEMGGGASGDGVLGTLNSAWPEYLPEEVSAVYGGERATALVVSARVAFTNLRGQEVPAYALRSTVRVRVTDHNRNADPGQSETFPLDVRSLVSNDTETLTLTETGPDTGVFEGSIASTDTGSAGADGVLLAPPGQLEASHMPTFSPNPVLRQVAILSTPAPVAADDTATTLEDDPVVIPVLANDSGAGVLTVAAVTQPSHGSVAINPDGTVTYTPAAGYDGPDAFTYLAVDAQGGEDVGDVAVTVTPDNQAPMPNPDNVTTPEDQPVVISVLANDTDPNNDTLRIVAVTQPSNGMVAIDPGEATVTFTPAPNDHGDVVFQYTVRDSEGLEATASVTVTVVPVNDPPVANDDAAGADEDAPVAIQVLSNDTDPDEDTVLEVTAVTQGAHGSVTINPNGTVTYAPDADSTATDSFTYTISDGQGGTDTATVTMAITPSNDAPSAVDDTATVAEDGEIDIDVLDNDTDPESSALQVDSVTQGDHGTVAINPDQTVRYTPAANFHGTDTFTYTADDGGNGGTDTAVVTVTVTPVNDAPAANADTALVAEDGTVSVPVLANDDDADDDTLTVTSVTQGADGVVAINPDQTVRYTPAEDFNGTDTFTYTVSDGNGGTATATVTVTIESDNDAPVAAADSATTPEDTAVTVTVLANDSDPDYDELDVLSVTQGSSGTVVLNANDTVTYTPALNFHGTDTFTYTVGDGNGGSHTATVTITATPVNDAPIANADTALAAEDGTVAVPVLANDDDADNDTLTVTSVTQGTHGAVAINPDQTVTYTPVANYNGPDAFTYTVSDGNGGTATATVSVTIGSDNDAPVAGADSATTAEDTAVTVTVLTNDSDPDNDVLDVLSVTQGTNGTVTLNANETVTYTPALNFHGTDTFTYTVGDGHGGTATATVTITVTPVNDAPVANADTALVSEDGSVAVPVLANDDDADNDTLTVTSVTQGAHGAVSINPNQTVTYTPVANYNGPDSFTYTIGDGNGGTATAAVSVTVGSDNDAPVAGADSATTAEDTAVTVTVLANDSDLDNDVLDVLSVTQGTNGTVVLNANETVTYTPALNFHGTDTFTYTVGDGNGGSATATVTITVTPVNDAPVANADSTPVAEDGAVAVPVLANDADADNDTLSVTSVTQGAHGSVTINPNQTVTYTPVANYSGSDSFTYTIGDGNGGTATAMVTVTVDSVNDAPTANPDAATVVEDGSVAVTVLANDSDPENNTLNVASVTQGAHGSVVINPNKTVTYAPAANYNGGDSFTYTINDGNGGTATATVTVTITAVNDAPVAVNDTATTLAETLVDIPVLANDVDVDGPSLSVQSVTPPAHGTVSINANQTVRYTPASGYTGADSFTYIARDGVGGTATATVSITVNAPPRVSTNLQVLYGFNEGSGTAVTDTSGVGTPLNLTIGSASAVTWISGGLQINSATLIQSAGAATKVITASQSTNAITLEAWINPLNTSQTGPLATVSQQANKQNFSLGQSTNRWDGHLRTSSTNNAGTGLTSAAGTATLNKTHVVYTRDASGNVRIYVNGVQSTSTTLTGTFSNWTSTYKLGLVNELGTGSPWLGKLYLVAIYNRALSSTEARQNWLAGE